MSDNDTALINRLSELSQRSFSRGIWTYSEFLTLAEQDILLRAKIPGTTAELYGGYLAAERKIAVFGSEELCGWSEEPPIVCVRIEPALQKFADTLSHRDFLGALMSLGIRREVMGDILIINNVGYLFCLESISSFIIDQLFSVKHTTVHCSLCEPPSETTEKPALSQTVVSSERLDAIIAGVYRLSRSESREIIESGKVFLSGRLEQRADAVIVPDTIVSVRGCGRFIYEGIEKETKKGRLRVCVRIFK